MKLFILLSAVGLFWASQMPSYAIADDAPICRKYFGKQAQITLDDLKKKEIEINSDESLGDYNSSARQAKIKAEIHPHVQAAIRNSLKNAKSLDEVFEIVKANNYTTGWSTEIKLSNEEIKSLAIAAFSRIQLTPQSIDKFYSALRQGLGYTTPGKKLASALFGEAQKALRTQEAKKFIASETKRQIGKPNPYTKGFIHWLAWEAVENHERHQQPVEWVKIKSTQAPLSQIAMHTVDGIELPTRFTNQIINSDSTMSWPQHPRNTTTTTPFLEQNGYPESAPITMHYTASRSMVLDGTTLSLKLPTNNPTESENDLTKADLRKSVVVSLSRGNLARRVEASLKPHPGVALLYDIASIVDRSTGNGFTVRDISLLNNGKMWFPTHSIVTMGERIAKKPTLNEARDYWIQNYLKVVANAKAILLLRYGLQMKYPHLQNTVLEFHNNMTPTGRIAVRDLSDTTFVEPIARVVAPKELEEDIENGFRVVNKISPILGDNTSNNSFRSTSAGALGFEIAFTPQEYKEFREETSEDNARSAHIVALDRLEKVEEGFFIDAIRSELMLEREFKDLKELQDYLYSTEGLNQIRAYHSRIQR